MTHTETLTSTQANVVAAIAARWSAESDLAKAQWTALYGTPRRRPVAARAIPALRVALAEALSAEEVATVACSAA